MAKIRWTNLPPTLRQHLFDRVRIAPTALELGQTVDIIAEMKTIAVIVDEATLQFLDELTDASPRLRNRSALVRTALREFAERARRREVEARNGEVFRKHRTRLARQARVLISEQARP